MQNGSELLACPCCKSAKYPPSAHVLDLRHSDQVF